MPSADPNNPYAPPKAKLEEPHQVKFRGALASPWGRLGAALIDTFASLIVIVPLQFATGLYSGFPKVQLTTQQTLLWGAAGFVLWLLIQGYFLVTRAQTLGKRLLGMQMVNVSDDLPAPIQKLVLLRYLPVFALGLLPIVGGLACLVDSLFIFRSDRRCVHDLIAGTKVILVPRS